MNRTRVCTNGVFGAWNATGSHLRNAPCDNTCLDDTFDIGAVLKPGQKQVSLYAKNGTPAGILNGLA